MTSKFQTPKAPFPFGPLLSTEIGSLKESKLPQGKREERSRRLLNRSLKGRGKPKIDFGSPKVETARFTQGGRE